MTHPSASPSSAEPASATPSLHNRWMRLDYALRFVWKSAPGWTVINLVLVVVQGPLPLLTLYLTKLMIDEVTAQVSSGTALDQSMETVAGLVALMALAALVGSLLSLLSGWVQQLQSLIVSDYMFDVIHAKSIEVDLEHYENPEFYNKLLRAQREAPSRPLRIMTNLTQLVRSGTTLLALSGLLLTFHWAVSIVLFVTVLPGFLVRLYYTRVNYNWQREFTETQRTASYLNILLTGNQYAKEMRLFELGPLFRARFQDVRRTLRTEQIRLTRRQSLASFAAGVFTTVIIYTGYGFIAYETLQGAITLGSLVMYYQAFQRGQGYLNQFLTGIASLFEDNMFLADLHEFLTLEPRITSPPDPQPMPAADQQSIRFADVSFQYPGGQRQALHNIDLTIEPGQKIALVGENGSGKTTLIKLLCRLYDPASGQVTINGVDLRELDVTGWRGQISVILQDYAHYHLSAQENIWLGNVRLPPDSPAIPAAARDAGADAVLARLPFGYDTILGRLFENGEELSIGEWQKVALARAFLREASIIILDEPTSAMDARAEYELFEHLRELTAGRTVILISHRFSTVRMADCIYVLENGTIIESGSHDDLLAQGGKYARLFEMQAQHYR